MSGTTGQGMATGSRSPARRDERLATETKHSLKTTEFFAMVALVIGILVSAAVIDGGDSGGDEFIARQAWLLVAIVGVGYMVSRGLAKSGSREPYWSGGSNEQRGGRDDA